MEQGSKLCKSYFSGVSTLALAKGLLGKTLVHQSPEGILSGRIVETEAYLFDDPACHSFSGKSKRNASMFLEAGHAYVYLIYGIHTCFNVVSGLENVGEAVLIRALEPMQGIETMQARRGLVSKSKKEIPIRHLCSGPGKLCQALGIGLKHDGLPLSKEPLHIYDAHFKGFNIVQTTRIGISKGMNLPYRFYIKDNKFVSKL